MGQGNIFIGICYSRSLCMISLPVWLPGPMFLPGVSVQEGLCPRRSLSRSVSIQKCLCPWGSLSRGSLSMGVSVHGGLCPWGSLSMGVSVHGGLCPWGFLRGDPQSEKQVVHILLECFLVFILFSCRMYFYEHDNANSFNTTHF